MSWSARQYLCFEDERTRPVRDLLAAVPGLNVRRVVDIGCGPGNSTEVLAERFPAARIEAFDSSADMVASARQRLPRVSFTVAAVEQWRDAGPFDVILANAVFQWMPGHETLFPALAAKLASGGALAIQMPDNLEAPAHRLMREVAAQGPWSKLLGAASAARAGIGSADDYYRMLRPHCAHVDVWRTTYHHVLAGGAPAVVEWFKGSGLRPFLDPLAAEHRAEYLERYTAAVADAYPAMRDGAVLLPFPRLFMVAVR